MGRPARPFEMPIGKQGILGRHFRADRHIFHALPAQNMRACWRVTVDLAPKFIRDIGADKGETVPELGKDPNSGTVGDDCRQDDLALQVIALLRDLFEVVGLNVYLFTYGVLPTGPERKMGNLEGKKLKHL
ncbi:unnamed protein product [Lupinus luteus]|uniref:Uncharacterized protein n=1 Tax=Lupinus luteus TaxID=3873 RepID=A0AAV1XFA1_LUPLU